MCTSPAQVVAVIFLTASGGWIKGSWITNYEHSMSLTAVVTVDGVVQLYVDKWYTLP